jgi:hypothetical protein
MFPCVADGLSGYEWQSNEEKGLSMVDFKKLSDRAKDLVEKRGGTEGLKQDATQLREIARGQGSIADKAKQAAAALKETGGSEPAAPAADASPAPERAPKSDPASPAVGDDKSAERQERKAERRKEKAQAKADRANPAP